MVTKTIDGFLISKSATLSNKQARALSNCVLGKKPDCNNCLCYDREDGRKRIVKGNNGRSVTLEELQFGQLIAHIDNMLPSQ